MINYKILADSIEYYESKGFQRIELPWTVTSAISNITRPVGAGEFTIIEKNKVLVASGEQSFLYLYNKGFLPKGRFMGITPCFRDEPFDPLHTKYFIKNELIDTENVTETNVFSIMKLAFEFFSKYLPKDDLGYEYKDGIHDIMYKNIELGSYGIRECSFLKWVFATGIAEPRLSTVIQKYGISQNKN